MNIFKRFIASLTTKTQQPAGISAEHARLLSQIDDIAANFGWDPTEEWVQQTKKNFSSPFYGRYGIHKLTYMVYGSFDPKDYMKPGSFSIVRARYDSACHPNPLDVYAKISFDLRAQSDFAPIGSIVVGSHNTTVKFKSGQTAAQFIGYGRKMHGGDAFRAYNAQQLIKELTGVDLNVEDIATPDLNRGGYRDLVLIRDEIGVWALCESTASHSA